MAVLCGLRTECVQARPVTDWFQCRHCFDRRGFGQGKRERQRAADVRADDPEAAGLEILGDPVESCKGVVHWNGVLVMTYPWVSTSVGVVSGWVVSGHHFRQCVV